MKTWIANLNLKHFPWNSSVAIYPIFSPTMTFRRPKPITNCTTPWNSHTHSLPPRFIQCNKKFETNANPQAMFHYLIGRYGYDLNKMVNLLAMGIWCIPRSFVTSYIDIAMTGTNFFHGLYLFMFYDFIESRVVY